jgi:alpha-glucoside transport system permease protein
MANTVRRTKAAFHESAAIRVMVWVTALIGILLALRASLGFIKDVESPERLLIRFYDLIGLDAQADALRDLGLNAFAGKLIIAMVALVIGVAGIWAIFIATNRIVDEFSAKWKARIRPYVFVGPAMFLLTIFLIVPTINTVYTSFTEDIITFPEEVDPELSGQSDVIPILAEGESKAEYSKTLVSFGTTEIAIVDSVNTSGEVLATALILRTGDNIRTFGIRNYTSTFTDPDMHVAFRNNILWLLFGVTGSVAIGLVVAQLVDRVKRESLAKTFIFMPLAISFVGAAVIWRFVYWWRPSGNVQIGLLNAVWTWMGNEPVAWMQSVPINTFGLIAIMIWLQTGFAMVILSAAIKAVPHDIIEAARIDGASEFRIFYKIIIPSINPTVITVATTVFIAILKVFDIVFVMTGGKFDTEVIANRMFSEMFKFRNFGRASSLAVILFVVVVPIIVINVKNLKRQGIGA